MGTTFQTAFVITFSPLSMLFTKKTSTVIPWIPIPWGSFQVCSTRTIKPYTKVTFCDS